MNKSLRSRLLLGIGATTLIGFAVAAGLIFVVLRASLLREFDALLASKVRALVTLIKQRGEELEIEFADHPMQEFARKVRPEYYEVWDEDGTAVARSRRLGSVHLRRGLGSLAAPGFQFTDLPDGRPGRLAAVQFLPAVEGENLENEPEDEEHDTDHDNLDRVDFTNRRRVTLVVARETAVIDRALVRLRSLLLGVSTSVVVTTLGMLVWLLKRSLRPLDELAAQLANLDERELAFRFHVSDMPLELGPMITRLNELLGRLDAAFQRERVFTADVAHELRTPLAGLKSTLEVALSRDRTSAEYAQRLRVCQEICGDTQRLVETLLSLARMEREPATLDRARVDVAAFVVSSWKAYAKRANERLLNVSFCGPAGIFLETDPAQFRIVLANLFDNAVEYTAAAGSVEVDWSATGNRFRMTVANSGCELSEEQLRQVFDRFWRADAARAATGAHAGLGLSLCQKIIELLGGSIDAVNRNGSFVVSIDFGKEFFERSADDDSTRSDALVDSVDWPLECCAETKEGSIRK